MRMYVHAVIIVSLGSCIDAYLGFLLSTTIDYVSLEWTTPHEHDNKRMMGTSTTGSTYSACPNAERDTIPSAKPSVKGDISYFLTVTESVTDMKCRSQCRCR